jgi:succinate dehydrogenase/fumarate reductase flavoprotein subunit
LAKKEIKEIKEADVLVIGGGLGGCMAALNAHRQGAKVIVVEKANVRRSGGAGTGNDHYGGIVIPGLSAWAVEDLVRDHTELAFGFVNQDLVYVMAAEGIDRVRDLEKLGVEFYKKGGQYYLFPQLHKVRSTLYMTGRTIKPKLAKELQRQEIPVLNRTMMVDLLIRDHRVVGAIGMNTRDGSLTLFKTKSVVLTTGACFRLFMNVTGVLMNTYYPPSSTGDGLAMALRAGAALTNMEGTNAIRGPKNLQRAGSGTYWPAKTVDAQGIPLDYPFPGESYYRWPAFTAGWTRTRVQEGKIRLPVFRDTTSLSPEEVEFIEWGLKEEGGCWMLLEWMKEQGKDFRTHLMEDDVYERRVSGGSGLLVDGQCQSTLPGLYAAGEVIAGLPWGAGPGAITLGWKAGGHAANYAQAVSSLEPPPDQVDQMLARVKRFDRKGHDQWPDANLALQRLMSSYMGDIRSEQGLKIGLYRLQELIGEWKMAARHPHETMRVLEIENLATIAKACLTAALERKASSHYHLHFRVDYPEWDPPEWKKWVLVRQQEDRISIEHREIEYKYH